MYLDFGKTIYVQGCRESDLDKVATTLNPSMTGEGQVCVSYDDLAEKVESMTEEEKQEEFNNFLLDTYTLINNTLPNDDPRGDVVFVS